MPPMPPQITESDATFNSKDQLLIAVYRVKTKKHLNCSLSFGQGLLTICLPEATSFLSQLMIWLEGDLLRPLPIRQVNIKSYLPSRKIYLSQMTRRDFFSPVLVQHGTVTLIKLCVDFYRNETASRCCHSFCVQAASTHICSFP